MEIDSMPAELDEVERAISRLEIEREALKRETDEASKDRLQRLERELAHLKEESSELRAHWQQEKAALTEIRDKRKQLEALRAEVERAERAADYAKAAELKYSTVANLEREIARAETRLAELQKGRKMLTEEVTPEDIADVVAKWTGIPVTKLLEGEVAKLLRMEQNLHQRVVGQDEAVTVVANAVRRARAGMQDPNRPLGSFLFLGPTGVGKTLLAKALAEFLFDDEKALVRLDMSEFLNRVDEIVIFKNLVTAQLMEIVEKETQILAKRLAERKITLDLSDNAKSLIAKEGFDPVYGARPIKRTIQRLVIDPLAQKVLAGEFKEGDTVFVDAQDGKIVFWSEQYAQEKAEEREREPAGAGRGRKMN